MPPEFLAVGRVLRPHGLRGELLLQSLTDFPERLEGVETVYLGEAAAPNRLLGVRVRRGELLIRLAEVVDREGADAFRGQLVQIRIEQAAPLPPGQYYHHQIIGLPVVTEEGEALGDVTGILETGANDVYVVSGPQGEILLPAIRSVVRQIDLDARRITVHLLEGLR